MRVKIAIVMYKRLTVQTPDIYSRQNLTFTR